MNNFRLINLLTGWAIGLIACTVYILTMEPTGSFWDCGEFISSCYKLQIPHPPGAPLFVLLGRFFIILFGDSPHTAARGVNFMSAIASGLSILFLFWSITHFARRLVLRNNIAAPTGLQIFTIMAAGSVGALRIKAGVAIKVSLRTEVYPHFLFVQVSLAQIESIRL